ncbi:MAG: cobyrinate a,c-diamide synthase [Candidatus Nealsonbacteria bacterium]|nr:cobyrinate a,c-diamide synthase [Candidatus Nealsonbacteria bacterium]
MSIPRILIAGLRGGGGKTLVSLGLAAAWRKQGYGVAPFKKGPDYIDAAWLAAAADRPCRNLDLFLMAADAVLQSFATHAAAADVAVIEGNRGLYDGMDARGSYSTAELAKLLQVPVVLVVDCTKSTRTAAALVLGCQRLDPEVPIRGVVLNRTAGARHEAVLREAIQQDCGLPVLGMIPKIREQLFPERHLGLTPPDEHNRQTHSIDRVAAVAEQYLDLPALWDVANKGVRTLCFQEEEKKGDITDFPEEISGVPFLRIGVFRDAAFSFYYPENIEALAREGAEVVEVSPLSDAALPQLDALYIGGGFPETAAGSLAENKAFIDSLRQQIERGLPVYAECGGAVYLGEKLLFDGNEYAMAGVLPVVFGFRAKPQGHGYTMLETVGDNPFYDVGESLRGHEFHYTYMQSTTTDDLKFAFRVRRGHGFDGRHDGLCRHNVLASYTHVHALGTESWAPSLVRAAARFRSHG